MRFKLMFALVFLIGLSACTMENGGWKEADEFFGYGPVGPSLETYRSTFHTPSGTWTGTTVCGYSCSTDFRKVK